MNETSELTKAQIADIDKVIKTKLTYKAVLSKSPPESIVRWHSFGKFNYLPITAVERLLDGLFESWTFEIKREAQVANGFYVVGTLKVKVPQSGEYLTADGIGFAEYQTKKGASPTDLTQIIQGAAVLAIPRAKAEAIKNAAKQLGNLFGRNLTRDDDNADIESDVVRDSRNRIAETLGANNETN